MIKWADFKSIVDAKTLDVQYMEQANQYDIFAFDGNIRYDTIIVKNAASKTIIGLNSSQEASNQTDFETNYKSTANQKVTYNVKTQENVSTLNPIGFSEALLNNSNKPKNKVIVSNGARVMLLNASKDDSKTWYISSWDGSGEGKGFYEIVERLPGSATLIEGFESITDWTKSARVSTLNTTTDKTEGTNAFKVDLEFSFNNVQTADIFYDYSPVLDLSIYTELGIDAKCNLATSTFGLKLHKAATDFTFVPVTVSSAGYGILTFDLNEAVTAGFDLTAVDRIEYQFFENVSGGSDDVFYLDNLVGLDVSTEVILDYFYASAYMPHQHLFPTALKITGISKSVRIYVTNKDTVSYDYEIGFNGREVTT